MVQQRNAQQYFTHVIQAHGQNFFGENSDEAWVATVSSDESSRSRNA